MKTYSDLQAVCAQASDALRRLDAEGPSGRVRAVPTGFEMLDRAIGGLYAQDLVVVAGRPGIGKTVTALQWARAVASSDLGVVYVCYEHDQFDLLSRLLCLEIGVYFAKHGESRGTYNAWVHLVDVAILVGLLWWGGFFG